MVLDSKTYKKFCPIIQKIVEKLSIEFDLNKTTFINNYYTKTKKNFSYYFNNINSLDSIVEILGVQLYFKKVTRQTVEKLEKSLEISIEMPCENKITLQPKNFKIWIEKFDDIIELNKEIEGKYIFQNIQEFVSDLNLGSIDENKYIEKFLKNNITHAGYLLNMSKQDIALILNINEFDEVIKTIKSNLTRWLF
jgi:hypothetical protein